MINDATQEDLEKLPTADFVDGFGSISQLRPNRYVNNIMISFLRDEKRKWNIADIERLIDYLVDIPF